MKRSLFVASLLTGLCIALSLVTLTTTGCSTLGINIVNPRYSIRDVRPRVDIALPLRQSSIDFDFALGIDNPNSVGIRLDRVEFDLFINDNPILTSVSNDPRIDIPARGYGEAHLRTRVGYDNVRNLWREIVDMVQGNRARYQLRGNAYYHTPLGSLRFPVTVHSGER